MDYTRRTTIGSYTRIHQCRLRSKKLFLIISYLTSHLVLVVVMAVIKTKKKEGRKIKWQENKSDAWHFPWPLKDRVSEERYVYKE